MSKKPNEAKLMIAASEHDADMFYATRFFVPDPFIYIEAAGKSYAIMSDLEIDRARKEACVSQTLSFSALAQEAASGRLKRPGMIDVISHFLHKKKIRKLSVPHHFPVGYADALRQKGFRLSPGERPFFGARLIKSRDEIAAIEETQRSTETAVHAAIDIISKARIKLGFLYHHNELLTSERIRQVIHQYLLARNCIGQHTIVASGAQACDPHQIGTGPLKANVPIILDVFPKSSRTNYYADMTRTVLRGKASPELKKLYRAVREGQDLGMSMVKAGVNGRIVHEAILRLFERQGYKTGLIKGCMQGFFHGTGHGLGLEVHEPPRIGHIDAILEPNMVVTVEPGLYYPGLGGVRLENMVLVQKNACRNLTRFPRVFEL
ncbi:MAG: aminopeptidase P family protein [Candidatus Omnitrophica bacterium]|nr:aminopeptidase P family protein [Candidatus Omnitrophota bacterium]